MKEKRRLKEEEDWRLEEGIMGQMGSLKRQFSVWGFDGCGGGENYKGI